MQTSVITRISDAENIRAEWTELLSRSQARDIFLTPEWFFAWWSVFGEERQLLLVAVRNNNTLMGLCPFYIQNKGLFRIMTLAGLPRHSDRADFILDAAAAPECLEAIADWLSEFKDTDIISLRSFGGMTGNAAALRGLLRARATPCAIGPDDPCPYILLSDHVGYDEWLASMRGRKSRKRIKSKAARLERLSGALWRATDNITPELIDEIAELDSKRGSRVAENKSFFSDPRNKTFISKFIRDLPDDAGARANLLYADGLLLAYDLSFVIGARALSYQTAFDTEFHSHSPGTLILLRSIRDAFENGRVEYDFLRGDEAYKKEWTRRSRATWRLAIYKSGVRGRMLRFYHSYLKPLRGRLGKYRWIRNIIPRGARQRWDI